MVDQAKKRIILVTGCSAGGIGAHLALVLAQLPEAHTVYATARDVSKIPAELSALPNVTTLPLDVTSASSVAAAAQAVASSGGLDVLVNNAGSGYTMPLLDVDVAYAQRVHDANVWGPIRTTQAFSDLLVSSGKGRVVNVSSVGAFVNTPWIGVYSSSKAALNMLSDTLRLELAPFGVSVVSLMIGTVATPFHANEPDVVLPEKSRYAGIVQTISDWAKGRAGPKGGSVEEIARSLVPDVLGTGGGQCHVWKGANSGAVRFMSRWLPVSVLVSNEAPFLTVVKSGEVADEWLCLGWYHVDWTGPG